MVYSIARQGFNFSYFWTLEEYSTKPASQLTLFSYLFWFFSLPDSVKRDWFDDWFLVYSKARHVVFSSNSLKMSIWYAISSRKVLLCSSVWKKHPTSVSIVWLELWKESLLLFGSNSLKLTVLADRNSDEVSIFW